MSTTSSFKKSCRELRQEYKNYDDLDSKLTKLAVEIDEIIEKNYKEEDEYDRQKIINELSGEEKNKVDEYDNLNEALLKCFFDQTDREISLTAGLATGVPAATIGGGGLAVAAPLM